MASVQIKSVPEQTHAVLRERAAKVRQPPQQYLLATLIEQASRPTKQEWLTRVESQPMVDIDLDAAVADIRAERDRR